MTTLSVGRVLKQQKRSTLRGATLTFESSSDGWVNFLALVALGFGPTVCVCCMCVSPYVSVCGP